MSFSPQCTRTGFGRVLLLLLMSWLLLPYTVSGADMEQMVNVSKRVELLQGYLRSDTARAIRDGDYPEVRELFDQAEVLYQEALQAIEVGEFDRAEETISRALRSYALASDTIARGANQAELAERNKQLRQEVDSYHQAFMSALREKGPSAANLLDNNRYQSLVDTAAQLSEQGDHDSANRLLTQAQNMVVTALSRIRANDTVVYSLDFRGPADEFRYEYQRYKGYIELSRKLLKEGTFDDRTRKLFMKYVAEALQYGKRGRSQAKGGVFDEAIASMESANNALVRGLRLLGLPVSQ